MPWKTRPRRAPGAPEPAGRTFSVEHQVPRVPVPTPHEFENYVAANTPVLIEGALRDWPAMKTWSFEHLAAVTGQHAGEVIISANGLFPDYESKPEPMTKRDMPFTEFARRVTAPGALPPILAPDETYYIYGKPYLFQAFPALKQDVPAPAFLGARRSNEVSLWASSTGCVTPLHYDLTNGLLSQIRGRKQVFLFKPADFARLYFRSDVFPGLDNYDRQSRVDIHHPDLSKFPRFAGVGALECTLAPGDMLFLPSNWAHEVETLEASLSVTFAFSGGTAVSEIAVLAEQVKRGALGTAESLASLAQLASTNPRAIEEMMNSPLFKNLLENPAALRTLATAFLKPKK
jgi:hypothetical protein